MSDDYGNERVRFNYGEMVALEMALLAQGQTEEGLTRLEKSALDKIRNAMQREQERI